MPRTFKAVPEAVNAPSAHLAAELGLPALAPGTPRLVMGRREWLALPELGVCPLNSKSDTGARGSSLHAEEIRIAPDHASVSFITYDATGKAVECEAPVEHFGRVRNSSGTVDQRVFIRTTAALPGGFRWPVIISLANRSQMRCPLLLGRRALAGYFLIDPLGSHLLGTRKQLEREFNRSQTPEPGGQM